MSFNLHNHPDLLGRTQIWWLRPTQGEGEPHSARGPGKALSARRTFLGVRLDDLPFPVLGASHSPPVHLLLGALREVPHFRWVCPVL